MASIEKRFIASTILISERKSVGILSCDLILFSDLPFGQSTAVVPVNLNVLKSTWRPLRERNKDFMVFSSVVIPPPYYSCKNLLENKTMYSS